MVLCVHGFSISGSEGLTILLEGRQGVHMASCLLVRRRGNEKGMFVFLGVHWKDTEEANKVVVSF